VFDPDTTEDEKAMAKHTIADILFPNYYNGNLGMDLEEAENDAAAANEELKEIISEMDLEEATFSDALRVGMERAGVTQRELAEKIGVGQPAIANMLKRQCRPQMRTVVRIAEALGVCPGDLWPPAKKRSVD
jgi:lambda repressor-like predicted transcriptional regulator